MIEMLVDASYECPVCCGPVKQDSATWNCGQCYHICHLYCVKKWADTLLKQTAGKTAHSSLSPCWNPGAVVREREGAMYVCREQQKLALSALSGTIHEVPKSVQVFLWKAQGPGVEPTRYATQLR